MDYYQVLQLDRTATIDDIKKSFRKLSLKYHPTKNPADITVCSDQFNQICEAYEVLSNFKTRTIYDAYGAETLSKGLHTIDGTSVPGQSSLGANFYGDKHKRNAFEIFENFFHEYLPYHDIFDDKGKDLLGSCFGYAYGGILNKKKRSKAPIVIHVTMQCTLDEMYNGCVKAINAETCHLIESESTTEQGIEPNFLLKQYIEKPGSALEDAIGPFDSSRVVEIKPGYTDGHEILLENYSVDPIEGSNRNVIVHLALKKHRKYTRKGDDLVYTHDVSLVDALNASPIKFKTLDNRILNVSVDHIITPQSVEVIENEGMPIYNKEEELAHIECSQKGKMYIRFNIIFPAKSLSEEKKKKFAQILAS